MNKIIVTEATEELTILDDTYLEISQTKNLYLRLHIDKNVKICLNFENNSGEMRIDYNVNNINLVVKAFTEGDEGSQWHNFFIRQRACLKSSTGGIISNKCELNYNLFHVDSDTKSLLDNNLVSDDNGEVKVKVGVYAHANLEKIKSMQNTKIINLNDSQSTICPNMFIETKDCIADHSAYIGPVRKEEVFYLCSKGLTILESQKILIDSLIHKHLTEEELKYYKGEKDNE